MAWSRRIGDEREHGEVRKTEEESEHDEVGEVAEARKGRCRRGQEVPDRGGGVRGRGEGAGWHC